jgi:predicted nucleotide-binding protein (sugar kinase/HSP70/actin superfamily)
MSTIPSAPEELEAKVEAYRQALCEEMGLEQPEVQHFKRPHESSLSLVEQGGTTLVYCGLTPTHEEIVLGVLEAMDYKAQRLPVPDQEALAIGKEFCNRGQCNPTYYTVGNLLKFLFELRRQGLSNEEIENSYALFWGADCGPCRMGMYEADLRKALKGAGFPNFRIVILDIAHGLDVHQESVGVQMTPRAFVRLAKAAMAADLVNDLVCQIRPYEVKQGETDAVLEESRQTLRTAIREGTSVGTALRRLKKRFSQIEVDYLRVKPRVKITGEFFLKHSEGDSNHRLMRWLEEEGAELMLDLVGAWFEYMVWLNELKVRDRLWVKPDKQGMEGANPWLVWGGLRLGKAAYEAVYTYYRFLLNFKPEALPPMGRLDRYSEGYYEKRLIAGEGHLEVTKHIWMTLQAKAHMMITVKPFGCMPSTISDGVQAKVVTDLADAIFVPIETTGDGEVLVKSRVQMKLQEAKEKAREEMERVLDGYGVTLEEIRAFARKHPKLSNAMRHLPHQPGLVSTAANFAADIARRMGRRQKKGALAGQLRPRKAIAYRGAAERPEGQ